MRSGVTDQVVRINRVGSFVHRDTIWENRLERMKNKAERIGNKSGEDPLEFN